jgi:hypothetical protein
VLAGIIIGAALAIAALLSVRLGGSVLRRERYVIGVSGTALVIAGTVVAVVLTGQGAGHDRRAPGMTGGLAVDDLARVSSSLRGPETIVQPGARVASVPSLIERLEGRLESEPADARGWALLAQSYAFVGAPELAERAVIRAVAQGFDESDLRQRVAIASRDPHAGLPGFAAAD